MFLYKFHAKGFARERGDLSQLVKKSNIADEDINLSILEKVKLIDTLDKDEKGCLLKMIDIAISKKKMKDNLTNMMKE